MLTLFAAPKAFEGHIGVIQRNAIRSWTLLRPACQIILMGNDDGIAEAAREFGLTHIPDLPCSIYGTPFINGIFAAAEAATTTDLMCYINADIILPGNFAAVAQAIAGTGQSFLMIGQRHDIDVTEPLDYSGDWEGGLRHLAETGGRLHEVTGIDYFVYPRGLYRGAIPPFLVGRVCWDNWMVYFARCLGVMVVDVTPTVQSFHQNHGYRHIVGHDDNPAVDRPGPEQDHNRLHAYSYAFAYTIADSTHRLDGGRLIPATAYGLQPNHPVRQSTGHGFDWLSTFDGVSNAIASSGYRPAEAALVRHFAHPGMIVLDVGAHHGFTTMVAAQAVSAQGRVMALEPSPREVTRLRMHLALNRLDNVRVDGVAAGAANGESDFFIASGNESERNSLRPPAVQQPVLRTQAQVVALDAYLELVMGAGASPDLVLIDAEGAELPILNGAAALLNRRPRPILLLRLSGATSAWGYETLAIILHLTWHRFQLGVADSSVAGPVPLRPLREGDLREATLIAIPEERLGQSSAVPIK